MLDTSQNKEALYQVQACWHSKSLTMSKISTELYNCSLCWIKKHDHWWSDKSFLAEQSSLISKLDKSNWYSKSFVRLLNWWSCHYIWIIRINEYRLNSMWTTDVWISWEILNLNEILQSILMWILWVELSSSALILILFNLILT